MSESISTFSVILVGDTEVGKTSIIKSFVHNSFDSEQKSTIGALFHTFKTEIKGQPVIIQIWDTAGQEKYRSLGPIYYRKAQAAIVVYDVTNPDSFKSLDQWILDVKQNTVKAVFYIAGNKSDLDASVNQEDAINYAQMKEAKIFFTSAKTGCNVKKMFESLFDDLYINYFQAPIPHVSSPSIDETNENSSCC